MSAGSDATEAHRRGVRDGAAAARAGVEPRDVEPYGLVSGRHAAQYGNGWEHGYVFAKREIRAVMADRSRSTAGEPGRTRGRTR